MMINPLLTMQELPPFSQIKIEHCVPALETVLAENRVQIAHLLETTQTPTWDNFVHPLNECNDRLERIWSLIQHLHNVADSEALRAAYTQCLPSLSAYRSEIGHTKGLYQSYQAIANGTEFARLNSAQQQVIRNEIRDFRLAGVELPADKKTRYTDIQQQLSKLSTQFSENVLDATQAWKKLITDEAELSGFPASLRAFLKQNAEREGLDGWLLTLDLPCYRPVMDYADNRDLRREMYFAYMTRASEQGPFAGQWDNSSVMLEILALRHELANLLGFANYAEFSLSTKMAENPEQVLDFLNDLAQRARPIALREFVELQAFAEEIAGLDKLEMWDIPYYSEKLRQRHYDVSQEMLRPYFPLPGVLTGFFAVLQRLYGLSFQRHENADVWHPDVQFFSVYDETNELRGQFYLDLYARHGKRGGAWISECITRKRTVQGVQTPVAYIMCNFTPPVEEQPSLLTHQEVVTLFHEFGHCLHGILTKVDYSPISGINGVAWDAVELPSQFMENWSWEKEALALFAKHYQSHEPLPDSLFAKMQAAKTFQAGLFMARQLEFALFDFRLHKDYHPEIKVQAILDDVRQQVAVLIPPAFNRFQHSFSHIFAGGYAAGYYSYKWAEVLAADAFSKFEENGVFDRMTGTQFLTEILEKGGSQEPMELFMAFRGRKPQIEALLRRSGLIVCHSRRGLPS